MNYTIVFARPARKELEKLDAKLAARILRRIEALSEEPRPRGSAKIRGTTDTWRIRSGDYRVVYQVDESQHLVDVVAVRHRKDAYEP